jgi:hypothetical protein
MMQDTGGGSPDDDIFKGVSELINIRYATMEIFCVVGLDKHSHGDFKDSRNFCRIVPHRSRCFPRPGEHFDISVVNRKTQAGL